MPIIPAQSPVARGCGRGKDFCEVVEDYPDLRELRQKVRLSLVKVEAQLVFSPLREEEAGRVRARLRGAPGMEPEPMDEDGDEIGDGSSTRQAAFSSETPACNSQQSFVYPRTARNRAREWRFVINVPGETAEQENYVQAVKVEIHFYYYYYDFKKGGEVHFYYHYYDFEKGGEVLEGGRDLQHRKCWL